jgi:tetratricopeptide (TPR) repeat protein
MIETLADLGTLGLRLLEITGGIVALTLVVVLVLGVVRSTYKGLRGKTTLVLPFRGSPNAFAVHAILADQLNRVENDWLELSESLRNEQEAGTAEDSPAFIPLPPARIDLHLSERLIDAVQEDPVDGEAIGPITIAGVSFSPTVLFAALSRIRTAVSKRTIRGSLYEFGTMVRLTATFTDKRKSRAIKPLIKELSNPGKLLDLIDDLAFRVSQQRLECISPTETWMGYKSFLEGCRLHLQFVRTGNARARDKAIERYRAAADLEPRFGLAHYNLGTLLYNRYEVTSNREAVHHFTAAAESPDERVQSLGLAGLALAYCQQAHRFGEDPAKVAPLADAASLKALNIRPDLEEVCLARAFALQIAGKIDDAIDWYTTTIDLPGDTASEKRVKSFASTNRGYLYMTERGDLDRAEKSFLTALDSFGYNQMAHANLGEVNRRRGQLDDAVSEYEEALRLDPTYINAMNELAMVLLEIAAKGSSEAVEDRLSVARQWHSRALALVPEDEQLQRDELRARFGAASRSSGFDDEAGAAKGPHG